MHLIYLDEVKYHLPDQPYYWLCGFAVDQNAITFLDQQTRAIAKWYFGTEEMRADTEFHAKHITGGKGPYKGHEIERRLELFAKLIDALCGHESIQRIEIRIDPSKIVYEKDPAQSAFMFFIERANRLMKVRESMGVLIADDESKKVSSGNVSSLCNYREWGTDWYFSQEIAHLVDTIHHTSSHHSRLVQLADIFVYACQLQNRDNLDFVKSKVLKHATDAGLYQVATYKYWPTSQSPWYQSHKKTTQQDA
jgi:hypothetical protein